MPDLYPIIEVTRESVRESEEMMGSKDKFWYLHPTEEEEYWLFKYPRCNTGEHWAEKIAAEVAALLEIPHARVELATLAEDKGSVTKSFVQEGQELVHGNQMLKRAIHGYDPEKEFRQSSHTLATMLKKDAARFTGRRQTGAGLAHWSWYGELLAAIQTFSVRR